MDLLGICRMLGALAGEAIGGKRNAGGEPQREESRASEDGAAKRADENGEFGDLVRSLGAIQEPWDPARALALKQSEIDALRKHLADLHDLGTRIAEFEQRQLAEKAAHEHEVAKLRRALIVARGKSVRGRAILRARRRGLAAKLRESEAALGAANERLAQGKERYERRRAEVEKLRQSGRELRQQAKERNAELRELRKKARALETEQQRALKWRERVQQQVRGLFDGRASLPESSSAETGKGIAALFALFPPEERRGRPPRKDD